MKISGQANFATDEHRLTRISSLRSLAGGMICLRKKSHDKAFEFSFVLTEIDQQPDFDTGCL